MSLDDVFGPYPGRPQHPDFARLADVVLEQDGKTEDPALDFPAVLASFIDPESITHMAMQRGDRAAAQLGPVPTFDEVVGLIAATYLDAFMVGYLYHERHGRKEPEG